MDRQGRPLDVWDVFIDPEGRPLEVLRKTK